MDSTENFLSIHENEYVNIVINKSEFIGYAFYVESQEEAENILEKVREENKEATHNCYAYIIGKEKLIQKYSDDGEPSGTAGIPMLEVLKKKDITNCLVIVTRYFGGVLLGAGGLVRAYTKAVALALEKAKIVRKEKFYLVEMYVDYVFWGKIQNILKNLNIEVINIEYLETVKCKLYINKSHFEEFQKVIIDETFDNCVISIKKEIYKSVSI